MPNHLDELLRVAMDHHQAGRLVEAEPIYRRILAAQPHHPNALHLLGVLAGQLGHVAPAIELVRQAISFRPDFEGAWRNLGRLLADDGNLNESVAAYTRVTELCPRDASAWYALGLACRHGERLDRAQAAFTTALKIDPQYAEAYNELAKLHRTGKRVNEAIAASRKATELRSGFADAHHTLANALNEKDASEELEEVIAEYKRAIELEPGVAQYHASLGDALCRRDQFTEAIGSFNTALTLMPTCAQARHGAGVALRELHRFEEAIELHKSALELEPASAEGYQAYGETLLVVHDVVGAERCFRRSLELKPEISVFWVRLGIALASSGKFDESAACFRKAIAIDPNDTGAYKGLASISREPADPEIERMTALLASGDLREEDRVAADFGLGKLLDDADRFDEAFERYAEGNSLYRARCAKEEIIFDATKLRKQVDKSIDQFTPDFFSRREGWGEVTDVPVFIVGMPRSGTTLVEQIAASHPQVFGAGELNQIDSCANAMGMPVDWDESRIRAAARAHLEHLKSLGGDHLRVTDKMPGNIMHLGLIASLFPGARIIFCHRDPRDNCLSCYFQFFKRHRLLFSYDLADCATQYLEQQRLTAHWLKSLPLQMMTMQYEELVADLEGQSRRLIQFLGLDWNPACLDFHKNERAIATASVWQVRQPLYNSSVGRWRNYEKHLGPLLRALGN